MLVEYNGKQFRVSDRTYENLEYQYPEQTKQMKKLKDHPRYYSFDEVKELFKQAEGTKGGIVNNFAEAIDVTIRVKHKNPKVAVDDTLAPLIVQTLNGLGFSTEYEFVRVELINPIPYSDLELIFDDD